MVDYCCSLLPQIDIDECALNTDGCDSNSECENSAGSFSCVCNSGYKLSTSSHTTCVGEFADNSLLIMFCKILSPSIMCQLLTDLYEDHCYSNWFSSLFI